MSGSHQPNPPNPQPPQHPPSPNTCPKCDAPITYAAALGSINQPKPTWCDSCNEKLKSIISGCVQIEQVIRNFRTSQLLSIKKLAWDGNDLAQELNVNVNVNVNLNVNHRLNRL
ncbi:hypothetical protein M7I_3069 [Glarea lozoyensis 74030]|uniref:Uncharacterized protein n=1 Tax=Glarea lozoyensis (strain ATCC 74030 / MF5533) TaxID=1104152 RepID=H0EKH1_GLAL7|nr:hypothetical protein M7I_3069 [Glarea lozoyensis 74030]